MQAQAAPLPESLLQARQEADLALLDELPRKLWLGGIIHSQGRLAPRLAGLNQLRQALLQGRQPDWAAMPWPSPALGQGLREIFTRLDLPGLCQYQSELSEQLISSLLWHLDLVPDYLDRGDSAAQARQRALDEFAAEWAERSELIEGYRSVFGDADELLKNSNWDQLRGLLRSKNWQQVLRARSLLDRMPELARLIQQLGRARVTELPDDGQTQDLQVIEPGQAPQARHELVHVPELPGHTRGVHRSGRIARMLPSEMLLLTHPKLRLLWHARHAERALLSYEDDERMLHARLETVPVLRPSLQRQPQRRMEAGPMLLCVDTSGSMQGGAEAVAKAVVLQAMRTAQAQKRACHLFAFGGPEEIVEIELSLDLQGLERLSEFMAQGFHGGTDICGPIERAIERLGMQGWQLADLLIASDGEFGATRASAAALAKAKAEQGLRVQGVLVSDRQTMGMKELADNIFWVREWRAMA